MRISISYSSLGKITYKVDGKECTREEYDAFSTVKPMGVPMLGGNTSACWPMKSDALAVHPEQIAEAMANDRKHGIATEYDPEDGRLILKDQAQKRDILKARQLHDNNGGYGTDHNISHAVDVPEDLSYIKAFDEATR